MVRRVVEEQEWDDDDSDLDEEASTGDTEESTIPCPYCKKQIHEDSPRCPHCENYISEEDAPLSRKPWWIIGGALVCLFIVYLWIVR